MSENISKFTFRMPSHTRAILENMAQLAKNEGNKDSESLNKLINHAINTFIGEIEEIESIEDLIKAQALINAKIEAYLKKSHLMNLKLAELLQQENPD